MSEANKIKKSFLFLYILDNHLNIPKFHVAASFIRNSGLAINSNLLEFFFCSLTDLFVFLT